ncbi:MAG: LptA/OstA family protein [Woeseiaceae bacterium]|nr:LptA/OstA family protein [Woeseiaceae bacterium]
MSAENSFPRALSRIAPLISPLVVAALLLPGMAFAQIAEMRLPISLDADSTDYDGKNSMLMFTGLRLSQGNIGVEADEGRASKLDFEDSVWRFSGNVVIDVENGRVECDVADVTFTNHQLILAVIEGTPATFELTRPGTGDTTYGEARRLRYDLETTTVEFSGDAVIREAGNEIASEFLAYNIIEQRIKAVSSGESDDKVRIRYTPPPGSGAALPDLGAAAVEQAAGDLPQEAAELVEAVSDDPDASTQIDELPAEEPAEETAEDPAEVEEPDAGTEGGA